jgi:Flp pilus assembly protein TadD
VVTGCSPGAQQDAAQPASTPPPDVIRTVALPDLTRADESVREQLTERFAALEALRASMTATAAEKAAAFGSVAVLLHAAEFYEAAEPAYEHARVLAPRDPKWPYLLAHLHKSHGEPAKAIAEFGQVVELSPRDPAALTWLGRMYLDQGEADKAEPLFERARAVAPDSVAALLGLGQAALARREFSKAASVLEDALRVSPSAASVHSPLAMAYRGLGDTAKAESHLRLWRNTEVVVPDPVPGAKPVITERINLNGASLEGKLQREATDRDVIV